MALVNNQFALNTVYNHYLTSYASKSSSRYDTHKKSELRNIYNSIIRQNRTAPLYLIDLNEDVQEFAVGTKENARELKNTISSLSSHDSRNVLDQKTAFSSNEDLVRAKYIDSDAGSDNIEPFEIEISQLASPQINLGNFLPDAECSLPPDTYSFDIHIGDTDYEFQFNVNPGETNRELQTKLSSLLNRSNIGLSSSVADSPDGMSSLRLESNAAGVLDIERGLFQVSDQNTSRRAGAVNYLGIGEMTSAPTNAVFSLNGSEHSAYSNTFTVSQKFELNLRGTTAEDSPVTIGLKPDVESMSDNIHQLIQSYNSFLTKTNIYSGGNVNAQKLITEMSRITNTYRNELDTMGLTTEKDGQISIDDNLLAQTLENEEENELHLNTIQDFAGSLVHKTNQISLNPMNYVDKIIVAYKNPNNAFANPYITSMYSGMLFNSYC